MVPMNSHELIDGNKQYFLFSAAQHHEVGATSSLNESWIPSCKLKNAGTQYFGARQLQVQHHLCLIWLQTTLVYP